jgi:hypothetical protein
LTLTALGPFESSDLDVARDLPLHEAGRPLEFNPKTLGVDAVATDGDSAFVGYSGRRAEQSIDVLLWPEARACELVPGSDTAYPGTNAGQALGFAERLGLALVAGENSADQRAGSALVLDTQTGQASPIERAHGALNAYRAFATVTPFGDGLLVAGGTNPFSEATSIVEVASTGELYAPGQRGFTAALVPLGFPRSHHAAVELPATGETLLIGGVVPSPNGGPGQAILQLEAVSPTQGSSISNLGSLYLGRAEPTALVLADGRIFVGGGYLPSVDASEPQGDPVGQVEWFSPQAGPEDHAYAQLPRRRHRTFAALPGGGVLSVASCWGEREALRRDCVCVTGTGAPCPDGGGEEFSAQAWVDAFWIGPDLVPRRVGFTLGNVAACPTPDEPLLVPGSDGSPWLVSHRPDGSACLFRFETWPEDPDGTSDDPTSRPRFVPSAISLDPAPDPASPLVALGPDAFVWTRTTGEGGLLGARLGHRGALTRDLGSLLDYDEQRPYRPAHLAPDRDPSAPSDGSAPLLRYARSTLTLEPAEPPLTLFVTDTLYDDVGIQLGTAALNDGAPPARPLVVFMSARGETSVCGFAPPAPADPEGELVVERSGRQVTLSAPGREDVGCEVPAGPVSLGVRADSATVVLTQLRVTRR